MSGTEQQLDIELDVLSEGGSEPEVVIVDDPSHVTEPPPAEAKKDEHDPAKALENLKKKLKKEKERADDAEQRAREATVRATNASSEVEDTHLHLVGNAIDTIKRDQDILKMNYRDSMANGDYDRAAEIQESMSMNSAKLLQLENGYNEMKNRPKPVPQQQPPRDLTVDDLIPRVTPKSAEWLKDNRRHLKDSRSLRIMGRAHDDAIDMGIDAETPDYFQFIEKRLGITEDQGADDGDSESFSAASAPVQRRQAPPAAPVSRSGNGTGQRPGQIRLTAEQVEYAKISGLTPHEYYQQMIREKNRPN